MNFDTIIVWLIDESSTEQALRSLINQSLKCKYHLIPHCFINIILVETQAAIYESITLSKFLYLLKKYQNNEDIVTLIIWLLSHLALNGM